MKIQAINCNAINFKAKPSKQTLSSPIEGHKCETVADLSYKLGYLSIDWYIPYCFNTAKSPKGLSVDMDDETNKANIATISKLGKNIATRDKLTKEYPLGKKEINEWANFGFIKPVMLQGIDGIERKSGLYDISDENNLRCIERLTQKRSRINTALLSQTNIDISASVDELSKLGFGSKEKIAQMVKDGKLKGRRSGDTIYVYMNNPQNQEILKKIRNSRTIGKEKAQEIYGISNYDFLREIYKGNIKTLEATLIGDMGDIRIDLSQGNNRESFLKTVLLSIAQFKLTSTNGEMHNSLMLNIAMALMPEIEETIKSLSEGQQDVINALNKKNEFENSNQIQKINFDDNQDIESEQYSEELISAERPTNEELALIDSFADELVSSIDLEKFTNTLKSAIKYVAQYKKSKNIALIDNPIAAKAILDYRHNYKSKEILT